MLTYWKHNRPSFIREVTLSMKAGFSCPNYHLSILPGQVSMDELWIGGTQVTSVTCDIAVAKLLTKS